MNYYPVTDGRTESDAYEPTMQYAQVGSKTEILSSTKMLQSKSNMPQVTIQGVY